MSENKCPSCGASIEFNATECKYCGQAIAVEQNMSAAQPVFQQQYSQQQPMFPQSEPIYSNKSKIVAGILAILLGGLGIHKFYLGKIGMGIVYILFCWTYIPSIIGIVEGIIYLVSSDEKFYYKYAKK